MADILVGDSGSLCHFRSPGVLMVGVIIGSKWMKINPDNVATPMAASFGDLITLALLAFFGRWAYAIVGKEWLWESCNFLFLPLGGAYRHKDETEQL